MARIPIGLELYSVRDDLKQDLEGTLKAVADMGYEGVEWAGHLLRPAADLKALTDDLGLVCCGWHCPFELVQDDKLAETIEVNQALGNTYVIIPGVGEEWQRTKADWERLAAFFNQLADKLAPHGLVTGYHNHHTEFQPLDGTTGWDTLFSHTKDSVVMQLDMGNALAGGADLIGILQRFPGRATTVHLKPYKEGAESMHAGFQPLIGDDSVPWQRVFEVLEETGDTDWYIVEYESDAYPPLESVKRCLQALRDMGK